MLLVLAVAVSWSIHSGWDVVITQGSLPSPDSFTRINRIIASIEAGQILGHVPRDNSGAVVPLHWSHLLDVMILALALPLWPFLGFDQALRIGAAAIGPLTCALAAWTAMRAARIAGLSPWPAACAGLLSGLSTGVYAYGSFGRTDHHLLMLAIATASLSLAWEARELGPRRAAWAGVLAGLGVWTSPEMMPFAVLGWAVTILGDTARDGRIGRRATLYAAAYLATAIVALVLDPPTAGRFAVVLDRLSRPIVEQALLMTAVALIGARLSPASTAPWRAAIISAVAALCAIGPWAVIYPQLLYGGGVSSEEGWRRIWVNNGELFSPFVDRGQFAFFLAVPLVVLPIACALLLAKRRTPLDVLVVIGALFMLYLGCRSIRLTIYPQQAAAIAMAIMLAWATASMPALRRFLVLTLATLVLAFLPMAGLAVFGVSKTNAVGGKDCNPGSASAALAPFAGRVVLSPYMDSPELVYFTKVLTVAGPYHRAERQILDSLDAYETRDFAGPAPPAAFARTRAAAVLVCTHQDHIEGTLGAALRDGRPPAWLEERPVAERSGYRFYVVR